MFQRCVLPPRSASGFPGVAQYSFWLQTGRPDFDPRQKQRISPLASVSRPALRPTQPAIQRVPGSFPPGINHGRSVTVTAHPHLVPRSRISRSYIPLSVSSCMACSGTSLLMYDFFISLANVASYFPFMVPLLFS
jgi:hypothetical protein